MSATLVPTTRTTYTPAQLVKGLVEGWFKLFKTVPKKESIGVLFSQNAIETGLSKSMWNNNIGNVKYVNNTADPPTIKYCMLANVWEIIGGKRVVFQPPHPATWFRAFDTLADGVEHHLNFLKNKRYKVAWSAVESGSVKDFAHLLKVQGYYTAPEADYIKGMNYYFNSYMKSKDYETAVQSLPKPVEPVPVPTPPAQPVPDPSPTPTEPVPPPPSDKLTVPGWQGTIYNILANAPWVKAIEWIGSLFGKKD